MKLAGSAHGHAIPARMAVAGIRKSQRISRSTHAIDEPVKHSITIAAVNAGIKSLKCTDRT
jgi:hypothetical protein